MYFMVSLPSVPAGRISTLSSRLRTSIEPIDTSHELLENFFRDG